MNQFFVSLRRHGRQYGLVLAVAAIIVLFQFLTNGILLRPLNVTNLILQNGYVLILALGMLFIILTGRIDLSVGSTVAFVSAVTGLVMVEYDMGAVAAVIIGLLVGVIIGAWHGMWTAYIGVPAFITSLSGMLIFRGLTIAALEGSTLGPLDPMFQAISTSFVPDLLNAQGINATALLVGLVLFVYLVVSEILRRQDTKRHGFKSSSMGYFLAKLVTMFAGIMALSYLLAAYNGIPTLFILLVALVFFYSFITNRTVIGRRIYALGGNEPAARLSGINTRWLVFLTNVNLQVLSAIAGIVFAARLNAATPKAGVGFELDAIAAVFIGGASVSGGTGTVVGALLGTLIMGVMNNGMSILGVSIDYQQAIKGLVILLAVAVDVQLKNQKA
jgi:putative multiple sugar transport system permease protein